MNALFGIVGVASSLSTLLVLIIFFISRIVVQKQLLRWVAVYSGISFFTDALLQFSAHKTNFTLLFTFTLLEYACFAWIFYMLLNKALHKKLIVLGSFLFLVIVCITLSNFGSQEFDNVNSGTEAILIIIYSILYFSEKLNIENLEPIFDHPGSYVVIGCLFYLAGNLFLFITTEAQNTSIWIINSLFNLIKNIFFLVAIRQCTKPKKAVSTLRYS